MSALMYFGSNGAYGSTDSTTTYTEWQQQMPHGVYAAGTQQLTNGSLQGLAAYIGGAQPVSQSLGDFMEQVAKPAKKAARGVLAKLAQEIDGWHGDVLERCSA